MRPASVSWSARVLAGSAVVFLAASTFYAFKLLAARCEGFSCTYLGVAWIFWLAVFCLPATLLAYFAQRSTALSSLPRSLLRAAGLAHSVFAFGLLVWWGLHRG
jgi:hypothetical protein